MTHMFKACIISLYQTSMAVNIHGTFCTLREAWKTLTFCLYLSLALTSGIIFIFLGRVYVVQASQHARLNSLLFQHLWFYFSMKKMYMWTVSSFSLLCSQPDVGFGDFAGQLGLLSAWGSAAVEARLNDLSTMRLPVCQGHFQTRDFPKSQGSVVFLSFP